ncbi:MAG: BatD family protein [Proteobacteria bacterium]|nr:BatD family protein [Pseudomonadota bacterium]
MVIPRGLVLALLSLAAFGGPAVADASLCHAEAAIEPARPYVGQQLRYVARLTRRADAEKVEWLRAPVFPDFRSEWLPGRPEHRRERHSEADFYTREEHRSVFPLRAGVLEIPPARLRCTSAATGESEEVALEALQVDVRPIPTEGRPPEWGGLVGPVQVKATVEPRRIALGQSFRISLQLRGAGNLWDAAPPFSDDAEFGASEVFRQPPALRIDTGEGVYLQRFFRFDVVPREPGSLVVPPVTVAFFDPHRGEFAQVRTAAVEVQVEALAAPPAANPASAVARPPTTAARPGSGLWWAAGGVLAAAGGVGVSELLRRRRRRREPVEAALREAADPEHSNRERARHLERALRAAVARRNPALAEASADEWSSRSPELAEAARALRELERHRFGHSQEPVDAAATRRTITQLLRGD